MADFAAGLDRRLNAASTAPIAVGVSGGGDSLALLLTALDWARTHGRRVIALTVDHRLHPDSAVWTTRALAAAARLGAEPHGLVWEGPKPTTGLPAAARDARHRLLAEAARGFGSGVLLLGHTADDLDEAAAMRAEGGSVGSPREWSPSPVWPEGRGVFLLRPLLGVRREALRDFLRSRGESWFDDPANDDLRYARARARASAPSTSFAGPPPPQAGEEKMVATFTPPSRNGGGGAARSAVTEGALLELPRAAITPHALAAACLCAAGHDRPPRRDRVEALAARLAAPGRVTATLGGARIQADATTVRIAREIGREGLPELPLPPGETVVWDGRYELTAQTPGLSVHALAGFAARLPLAERAALATIPAFARPALPAIVNSAGAVSCPILAGDRSLRIAPLALGRFIAACGLTARE
jgi:tRNA(Ile)-lysidine synthase